MLLKENFSEEYIRELQRSSKRDSVLLERTVYAFGLLLRQVCQVAFFLLNYIQETES